MSMADVAGQDASWTLGSVLGTAGRIFLSRFIPFVAIALIVSLPSLIFSLLLPESYLRSVIDLIVAQIVTVTVLYGAVQALRGRQVSMLQSLNRGMNGRAFGVAILSSLGVALGAIALIVPGVILWAMWAVAIPVAVMEKTGVKASLSRSSALTRDRRWRIVGALLMTILATFVGGGAIGALAALIGLLDQPIFEVLMWAVIAIAQVFSTCVVATLYYFLRRDKEGVDIDQIASVFD